MLLKIAICDDDRLHLEKYGMRLRELIDKHGIDAEVILYSSGKELLFHLEDKKYRPDILYLDIHMPGEDGMTVAQEIRGQNYSLDIIFLTGAKDRVFEAFDVRAFHYILKEENNPDKFEKVFCDVIKNYEDRYTSMIHFECAGKTCAVAIKDIFYFDVNGKIVTVHYRGGTFSFISTLARIEERLAEHGFIRASKSHIINIWKVDKKSYNMVTLMDGTVISIGRSFRSAFKDMPKST